MGRTKSKRKHLQASNEQTFKNQSNNNSNGGGVGIHRKLNLQTATVSNNNRSNTTFGSEYRSKKAGGDAKRKGNKFDPYAYIPLQRSSLNKRKRAMAVGQFKGIVKNGKVKKRNRKVEFKVKKR